MHAANELRWRLVLGCLTLFAIAAGDTAPAAQPALYASYTLPAVPALSAVTPATALPPVATAPTLEAAAPAAAPSAAVAAPSAPAATPPPTPAPIPPSAPVPTSAPLPTNAPPPTAAPAPTAPPPPPTVPPPPPTAAPATACAAGWFCYPRVGVSGPIVPYTDCAGGADVGTAIRAFTCLSPRYLMGHAYTQFGRIAQWRAGDVVYAYGQAFTITGALTARSCEPPPLPLAPLSLQTSLSPDACGAVLIVQAR